MAFADTAQLAVELKLKDNLSGGLTQASSKVKELEATAGSAATRGVGGLSTGFSKAGHAAGEFRGKISEAGSKLKDFAFGPLGLIGVTGGLLTMGGAIEEGIKKAQEFGGEVQKLSAVSGLSIETTSALAAALDHFGVGAEKSLKLVGFLEKNVGLLASRKDGITGFEKSFSLALTDTNGHLKDANELILTSADYFNNKAIPATTKAAALSKLYGRSWQDMIPFLKAGRQGIADAEEQAAKFGLTLTKDNIGALQKMKAATRDWGDALGGLELQIGLALIPSLTELAKSATMFVSQNRDKIVSFFKDAAKFAGELGRVVHDDVLPVFKGIAGAWDALPQQLKDLLITGLVAGKVSKVLFDFGPMDFLKKGIDLVFQKGGSPANPLFVADVTGGLGKAGVPVAPAAAAGLVAPIAATAAILASPFVLSWVARTFNPTNDPRSPFGRTYDPTFSATQQAATGTPTASRTPNFSGPSGAVTNAPLGEHALDRLVDADNKANAVIGAGLTQGHRDMDKLDGTVVGLKVGVMSLHGPLNKLDATFHRDMAALTSATKADEIRKFADKVANEIREGVGSLATTEKTLDHLKARRDEALRAGNKALAAALGRDIAKVQAKIPGREYVQKQIDKAQALVSSSESQKRKLDGLHTIIAALKARGDIHAANEVAKLIAIRQSVDKVAGAISHFNPNTGRVDVTVTTTDAKTGKKTTTTTQTGPTRNAAGGPLADYTLVGEEGPELVDKRRQWVYKSSQTADYLSRFLNRMVAQTQPTRPLARPSTHLWQGQHAPSRLLVNSAVTVKAEISTSSLARAVTVAKRYGTQWS